jgi:cardiolipin synthase (CMP-forming)
VRAIPNLLCLLRIALIWPIVSSIGEAQYTHTLALFVLAAFTDGLDGFLAKRFHWTSELGKLLDPLADKLLLIAVFLVASWHELIPPLLTALAVARDLSIGLGALVYRVGWGVLRGHPTLSSKLNTLAQVTYVIAVIAHAAFGQPGEGLIWTLAGLTVCTLVLSGYGYVREYTRRALGVASA